MTSVQEMHTTCEDCGWRHAMTDSTNAKLRELRERVARDEMRVGLVAGASLTYLNKTPYGPCVYRQEVLSLIDVAFVLSLIDPGAGWAALGIIGGFVAGICFAEIFRAEMMEGGE